MTCNGASRLMTRPALGSGAGWDNQIEDGFQPHGLVEAARSFPIAAGQRCAPLSKGKRDRGHSCAWALILTFGDITRGELLGARPAAPPATVTAWGQNTDGDGFGLLSGGYGAGSADSVPAVGPWL